MKKILLVSSVLFLFGCASNGNNELMFKEKEAEVMRSTYVEKFCMDTSNLNMLSHYHKDIKERGFFNSYTQSLVIPDHKRMDYECRVGAYRNKVMLLDKELKGSRYIHVMTKNKQKVGNKIKVMVKE